MLDHQSIPAAQYLRMSTDQQQYSLPYQKRAIAEYAEKHGFRIVETYADPGRSGLQLSNRPGLRSLLQDVVANRGYFRAILVYDISRWGRFQDVDEAAHYEFLCKNSGIPVYYCAEQFDNEPSLANVIFKTFKRSMAAEYSRELSEKLYRATRVRVDHGLWPGGDPGYGYRRLLLTPEGKPKQVLQPGEQKTLKAGNVTLTLGPKHEVAVVRSIYKMLLDKHMNATQIMSHLNRRGIPYQGRHWSFHAVKSVLTNPKYAGTLVWGRTEWKLQKKATRLPREKWITKPGVFPAIVDQQTFSKAQKAYYDRTCCKTDEQLLDDLRRLWRRAGRLGSRLIELSRVTPAAGTYKRRFGTLNRVYDLIGYHPPKSYVGRVKSCRNAVRIRRQIIKALVALFPGYLVAGPRDGYVTCSLPKTDIAITVCSAFVNWKQPVWAPRMRRDQAHTMTLLCLLNRSNTKVKGYYFYPRLPAQQRCRLYRHSKLLSGGTKLKSLRHFYGAVVNAYRHLPDSERHRTPEVLYGVPDIARYLEVSYGIAWRLLRHGMPVTRGGRRTILGDPEQIGEWIRRNGIAWNAQRDHLGRFLSKAAYPKLR